LGKIGRPYSSALKFRRSLQTLREAHYTGSGEANPPAVVWRGFSGHWMAFYSAALAILYSAAHAKHNGWRCPNGLGSEERTLL